MQQDNKNFILAIVLTMAILLGYEFFISKPQKEAAEKARQEQLLAQKAADNASVPQMSAPGTIPGMDAPVIKDTPQDRKEQLATTPRIPIVSPRVHGSISLRGGRLDDLTLRDYHVEVDGKEEVVLLSPAGSGKGYYAEFGWAGVENGPDKNTIWTADKGELNAGDKVTLSWANGKGLVFKRTVGLDENYMFTLSQSVTNTGETPVTLAPYGLVSRESRPTGQKLFILHEGPLWVTGEGKEEFDYGDIEDETEKAHGLAGGWLGITDKYWLVALIPDDREEFDARILRHATARGERFQADYILASRVVNPGQTVEVSDKLFAGAKEVELLDQYRETQNIRLFNYAIDWGWFDFLTKPIFYVLDFLFGLVGNFGVAILLLTVGIRLVLFPVANKQFVSMSKMKKLTPKMKALKEKYGDDRMRMQQETMALYKNEKVNPLASCLPIVIQIPIFFALYKTLYVTIDMRHEPFVLWIKDLAAPDPLLVTNLFGLIPWDPPTFLAVGILPVLMGVTMWLQQKLNPAAMDPVQQKIFMFMPIMFTFILANFAVGLVIYWTWNNILSIIQQWIIMRRVDAEVPEKDS
ncbi:membrane protein insertase YidC [Emcibacter sp.]|uniref:membrane protein insertase YidC n=1 Tax=Emcibacter sp. TaxID=1979954 RepID=UPI002AA769AF|nr:membrane protein insertase YidC [Emcibacter sp.]